MNKLVLALSFFISASFVCADFKTTLTKLETLANQGDLNAQINLATAYRKGTGVTQDYKKAVKWFTLAAEQGNALAQYNLGRLYYLGQGVSENLVYAHMWSKQSSRNGFKMGEDLSKLLIDFMSTAQIEQANQLENDCLKKKYKEC